MNHSIGIRTRLVIGLGLLVVASTASATTTWLLGSTVVTGYSVYTTGASIFVTPLNPGAEGCTYAPGGNIWIDFAQPEGKTLYATFLAAMLAGKSLGFATSGCGASGQVPLVYRVDVGL